MIFLLCKLVSKLVIIVTNNFWSLKLVTNEAFSCSIKPLGKFDGIKIPLGEKL